MEEGTQKGQVAKLMKIPAGPPGTRWPGLQTDISGCAVATLSIAQPRPATAFLPLHPWRSACGKFISKAPERHVAPGLGFKKMEWIPVTQPLLEISKGFIMDTWRRGRGHPGQFAFLTIRLSLRHSPSLTSAVMPRQGFADSAHTKNKSKRPSAGITTAPLWSLRIGGRLSFLSPQLKTSPEPKLSINIQLCFQFLNL